MTGSNYISYSGDFLATHKDFDKDSDKDSSPPYDLLLLNGCDASYADFSQVRADKIIMIGTHLDIAAPATPEGVEILDASEDIVRTPQELKLKLMARPAWLNDAEKDALIKDLNDTKTALEGKLPAIEAFSSVQPFSSQMSNNTQVGAQLQAIEAALEILCPEQFKGPSQNSRFQA